jgi:hypothetical protein
MEDSAVIIVLTSMITPAVLILACGSLSLTTSQRLSRSISRTRKILNDFKDIQNGKLVITDDEKIMLHRQMITSANRAVLLQRVMTMLYVSLSFFIATSLLIGIFEIMGWKQLWILLFFPMLGAIALLAASILLIIETRFALGSVDEEMKFNLREGIKFIRNEVRD